MSNITAQRITEEEIYLSAGHGREFLWQRADIEAKHQEELGKRGETKEEQAEAKAAAVTFTKEEIAKALGSDTVRVDDLQFDFAADGQPVTLASGDGIGKREWQVLP